MSGRSTAIGIDLGGTNIIGAVVTPFAFLLIASFFPFSDLLVVALSTALVGSGAFLTSLYVKSNR